MPGRKTPLVNNQYYHIINRGVASQPVFLNAKDYQRMSELIWYYQNQNTPLSYSHFSRLPIKQKGEHLERLKQQKKFIIEVIALCLMPNHFHFLLKQVQDNGISNFLSKVTNGYTRYFNTKRVRVGPLFQGKFKSVLIEIDEQLLHVSRYIHLNPYAQFVVKSLKDLEKYPYSSLPEYLGKIKLDFFQKEIILDQYKKRGEYKKLVFDQAEYQRRLEQIKHLTLE